MLGDATNIDELKKYIDKFAHLEPQATQAQAGHQDQHGGAAEEAASLIIPGSNNLTQAQAQSINDVVFSPKELAVLDLAHKHHMTRQAVKDLINLIQSDQFKDDDTVLHPNLLAQFDAAMHDQLFKVMY